MIPYFAVTQIHLGPIAIQVWGLMVALGFLIGAKASAWMLKRRGLDPKIVWDLLFWLVLGSMLFARLFHVFLYEPGYYVTNPFEVIAIWNGGLSMIGGLIGAVIAGVWFLKRKKLDVWKYADSLVFGLPLGYAIGLIVCFLPLMDPGTQTTVFLGVKYPDGVVRHDLGLYELLNGALLFAFFLLLARRKVGQGIFLVVFLIWYGASRFLLDFLRATEGMIVDTRYLGLTPAQYAGSAMLVIGMLFFPSLRGGQRPTKQSP